jgi:hypothetical protein
MDKRRFIQQLPEVHNTETLKKFFGATVDQIFQPGSSEQLSGYIGSKPAYFDSEKDFYLTEPTAIRAAYQFDPAMVSQAENGDVTNILTYDDFMAYLRAENAITVDHDRMFGDTSYGWVPPVDLDKLGNYRQYYWFGDQPNLLPPVVLSVSNTTYTADGQTHIFEMPSAIDGVSADRETPAVFVDGLPVEMQVVGQSVALVETPGAGASICVFRYADLTAVLDGQVNIDPRLFNPALPMDRLTSNMRLRLEDGIAFFQGFGRMPYETVFIKIPRLCQERFQVPWDEYTRPSDFFVEGVGSRIVVAPYPARMTYKEHDATYTVINRRDIARSPWVVNNFWVHESAFRWAEKSFPSRRAKRPIVEFLPNLELMNYGLRPLETITGTLTGDPMYVPILLDKVDATKGISDWDVYPFDTETYESSGIRPIPLIQTNGKLVGQLFVDGGKMLNFGDRILVIQNSYPELSGSILRVRLGTQPITVTLPDGTTQTQTQSVLVLVPEKAAIPGDTVRLERGRLVPWDKAAGTENWFISHNGSDRLPWEFLSEAVEYHFDGTEGGDGSLWRESQAPHADRREPQFALYTDEKVRLDRLPNGSFLGNRLFGYTPANEETGRLDAALGQYVIYDSKDAIQFRFDQATERYTANGQPVVGFQYYRVYGQNGQPDTYSNSWHVTGERSHQTLTNGLFSTPQNLVANPNNEEVSTVSRRDWLENFANVFIRQEGFTGSPYNINNWRDSAQTPGLGFNGPVWQMGHDYAVGDTCKHLNKVYRCTQAHTSSISFDVRYWAIRPTHQIVQNKSPLLRTMLLASDKRFDYLDAVRYLDAEYARFRNKFRAQTIEVRRTGQLTDANDHDVWVETILNNLKFTKTNDFPFSLSSMAGGQYFIPPTAAQMGLLNTYEPTYEYDDTYTPAALFLRGHDGSRTPVVGSFEDDILLALERRIWVNIVPQFKSEAKRPFDFFGLIDGRNRGDGNGDETSAGDPNPCDNDPNPIETGRTTYSLAEVVRVYTPVFLRYAQLNGIDYRSHKDYVGTDPFTFNYRDEKDRDGTKMPGNWRAIYRYYYDTDRPHACPWEMLGFGQKPVWWDVEYGVAPYTSGNVAMWEDLRDGRIRQGVRAGIDPLFVRPDLFDVLPVTEDGRLRDPLQIGIFAQAPSPELAARDWLVGDGGPGEQFWMNSASYPFAKSQIGYLLRPAEWIEVNWDSEYFRFLEDGQAINTRSHNRTRAAENVVHGETIDARAGTRFAILGVQQWVSDLMASRAQSPSLLGSALRRMRVQMMHKMAGFTKADNLRVFADNFGIIPEEDVSVILHNSPPIRESVYSGVIIEWTGDGYQVIGYDTVKEGFCINKGDETSKPITISLGDEPQVYEWHSGIYYALNTLVDYRGSTYRAILAHTASAVFDEEFWTPEPIRRTRFPKVTVFSRGEGTLTYVPYSTVFKTLQDVASFLWDYGRALEDDGFVFDYIDPKTGDVVNWEQAIREFLAWAQTDWQPGNFIALSPGASQLKYITKHGVVYNVEETSNGIYGLLNRTGTPLPTRQTFVSRLDEETKVITISNDLFCARLRVGEIEHIVLFSNKTIFGDVIYAPLLNLRQSRLRLLGMRTKNWTGRLDAPGYMVEGNTTQPNFWRAAENLRTMFDVEGSEDRDLRDFSRHLLGYQKRPYLDNLLVSETEQFEFYQGMIKQKGTPGSFEKLTRSQLIDRQSDLAFLEEWGFNVGRFGAVDKSRRVSFMLTRTDMRSNPQLIEFGRDNQFDAIVGLPDDSSRWVEKPANVNQVFPERQLIVDVSGSGSPITRPYARDLHTSGPVRISEITHTIANPALADKLFTDVTARGDEFSPNDRIWVYELGLSERRWSVFRFDLVGKNEATPLVAVEAMDAGDDNTPFSGLTRLTFLQFHGLDEGDIGSLLLIPNSISGDSDVEGFHQIIAIEDAYSIVIPYAIDPNYNYKQPFCMVLRSVRFRTIADRNLFDTKYGFVAGELAYVDHVPGFAGWVVFRYDGSAFNLYRQQPPRIDSDRLRNTLIYDLNTKVTDASLQAQPLSYDEFTVVDPISGNVSGEAEREITFRVDYDPAQYIELSEQWGASHVGELWWDTLTSIFLDTSTDIVTTTDDPRRLEREMTYRSQNWGKVAPGCSVDVYEWTRSFDPPTAEQLVRNRTTDFTFFNEFDPALNKIVVAYYFWVRNPTVTPNVKGRSLSAAQVAKMIEDPRAADVAWIAPIAPNAMLLCNAEEFLNDTGTVVQFELTDDAYDGVNHEQFALVRKGDPDSLPPKPLLTTLRNSITEFDDFIRPVPEGGLGAFGSVGATRRSRRTMIANGRSGVLAARQSFITKLNEILGRSPLLVDQPSALEELTLESPVYEKLIWNQPPGTDWIDVPPRGSYDFVVNGLEERRVLLTTAEYLAACGFSGWDTFKYDTTGWDYDFGVTVADLAKNRLPRVLMTNYTAEQPGWSIWEGKVSVRGPTPQTVITITDTPLSNIGPIARDDAFSVTSGQSWTLTAASLSNNDTDQDNDILTVVSVGPAPEGSGVVTQVAPGTWLYQSAPDVIGRVLIPYVVADGKGGVASAYAIFTLTPPEVIKAVQDTYSAEVNTPLVIRVSDLLANDIGDDIVVVSVTQPLNGGFVTFENSAVVYNPPVNSPETDDLFTYTIRSASGRLSNTTVLVTLAASRIAAADDYTATNYGATLTIPYTTILANDSGEGIVVDSIGVPLYGAAVMRDDGIRYTAPAVKTTGDRINPVADAIPYTIRDKFNQTTSAKVVISFIRPRIEAFKDETSVNYGAKTNVGFSTILSNDVGQNIIVTGISKAPAYGTARMTPVGIEYIAPAYSIKDGFTPVSDVLKYTIVDPFGQTSEAEIRFNFTSPPRINAADDEYTINYGASLNLPANSVMANDAGRDIRITAIGQARYGVATLTDTGISYVAPAFSPAGNPPSDTFTYSIADTFGQTAQASIVVNFLRPAGIKANDDYFSVVRKSRSVIQANDDVLILGNVVGQGRRGTKVVHGSDTASSVISGNTLTVLGVTCEFNPESNLSSALSAFNSSFDAIQEGLFMLITNDQDLEIFDPSLPGSVSLVIRAPVPPTGSLPADLFGATVTTTETSLPSSVEFTYDQLMENDTHTLPIEVISVGVEGLRMFPLPNGRGYRYVGLGYQEAFTFPYTIRDTSGATSTANVTIYPGLG